MEGLHDENEVEVSILFYLQKMYPDEWKNFQQHVLGTEDQVLRAHGKHFKVKILQSQEKEHCHMVSYQEKTLTRIARGMMYNRKNLGFQSFLDMTKDEEFLGSYKSVIGSMIDEQRKSQISLPVQLYAIIDILNLMITYPYIQMAYIDQVEVRDKDKTHKGSYSPC